MLFFCATVYALDDCASCNYAALTWNSWLMAFVMILCPLWFNPFIFNLSKVGGPGSEREWGLLGAEGGGLAQSAAMWVREARHGRRSATAARCNTTEGPCLSAHKQHIACTAIPALALAPPPPDPSILTVAAQGCDSQSMPWAPSNASTLTYGTLNFLIMIGPPPSRNSQVQREYTSWKRWLSGDVDAGTGSNWYTWNREQLAKARNDDGNVTDAWRNSWREVVGSCLPYGLLCLAMMSKVDFSVAVSREEKHVQLEYYMLLSIGCVTHVRYSALPSPAMVSKVDFSVAVSRGGERKQGAYNRCRCTRER